MSSNGQSNGSQFMHVYSSELMADNTDVSMMDHSAIAGRNGYFTHVYDAQLKGDNGMAMSVINSTIDGDDSLLMSVSNSDIKGNVNMLFSAQNTVVQGNNNRVFGSNNTIIGDHNVVFGDQVQVVSDQSIVFNASSDQSVVVTNNASVIFSAPKGLYVSTGTDMLVAANAHAGGWSMVSDRHLKTNFKHIDYLDVFDRFMSLPIYEWEYVFNKGVTHLGPMAHDFEDLFRVGDDDRFINSIDSDGISFAVLHHLVMQLDRYFHDDHLPVLIDWDLLIELLNSFSGHMDDLNQIMVEKNMTLDTIIHNNIDQYMQIDNQFKRMTQIDGVLSTKWLFGQLIFILFVLFIGILLGFYGFNRYYKT